MILDIEFYGTLPADMYSELLKTRFTVRLKHGKNAHRFKNMILDEYRIQTEQVSIDGKSRIYKGEMTLKQVI